MNSPLCVLHILVFHFVNTLYNIIFLVSARRREIMSYISKLLFNKPTGIWVQDCDMNASDFSEYIIICVTQQT